MCISLLILLFLSLNWRSDLVIKDRQQGAGKSVSTPPGSRLGVWDGEKDWDLEWRRMEGAARKSELTRPTGGLVASDVVLGEGLGTPL